MVMLFWHWIGDFHRNRYFHMLLAHLLNNFIALLVVAVTFYNLVILLTLLLESLDTLLFWHVHCGGKALSANSARKGN